MSSKKKELYEQVVSQIKLMASVWEHSNLDIPAPLTPFSAAKEVLGSFSSAMAVMDSGDIYDAADDTLQTLYKAAGVLYNYCVTLYNRFGFAKELLSDKNKTGNSKRAEAAYLYYGLNFKNPSVDACKTAAAYMQRDLTRAIKMRDGSGGISMLSKGFKVKGFFKRRVTTMGALDLAIIEETCETCARIKEVVDKLEPVMLNQMRSLERYTLKVEEWERTIRASKKNMQSASVKSPR